METISHKINLDKNGKEKIIDATMIYVNLPHFIKLLKEEEEWQKSDRNNHTLLKTNILRIILIALRKGAIIKKQTSPQMLQVQVIEGNINFTTDVQTIQLVAGDIIALYDGIPYTVAATEETVFLLTLTGVAHN